MSTVPLDIAGPAYALEAREIECQRTVNFYAEAVESGKGRARASLIGIPGLGLFADLMSTAQQPTDANGNPVLGQGPPQNGPVRGIYRASNGVFYVVAGTALVSVQPDGSYAIVGPLPGASFTTGPVRMADNGQALMIVDGSPQGWTLTFSTNVSTGASQATTFQPQLISDPAFTGATTVVCIDGYFLFDRTGTGQFYLATGTSFDALDFATAEYSPDVIVGLAKSKRVLWIFGPQSVEFWANTGDADFPFAPIQGAALDIGCVAPRSIARLDDNIFWLGSTNEGGPVVYRGTPGYQAQRVSTTAIEQSIGAGTTGDAIGLAWHELGHLFYALVLPTQGRTWVFDQSTGLWHERAMLNTANGQLQPPRYATVGVLGNGTILFGDATWPRLYRSDPASDQDVDRPVPYIRVLPHLFAVGNRRLKVDALEIVAQTGADGAPGDLGPAPAARMAWSEDGGYTFGNEHAASMGLAGQRGLRVRWRRLGMARDRVVRFTFTGIRPRIASGHADITPCRN